MADEADRLPSEQRKHPRKLVVVPAYLGAERTPDRSVVLVRNISIEGAYLLTQQRFEPGDEVELSLHWTGDPAGLQRETSAVVVRVEPLDPATTDLWLYGVGVRFGEALTDSEAEISRLARMLAEAQSAGTAG